jgi:hypothetical protein
MNATAVRKPSRLHRPEYRDETSDGAKAPSGLTARTGGADSFPESVHSGNAPESPYVTIKGECMKPTSGILTAAFVAVATGVILLAPLLDSGGAWAQISAPATDPSTQETTEVKDQEFPVPVQPLPKTITPCRACHGPEKDFPINFKRTEALLVHRNLKLNHGGAKVWCLDCHHPEDRNNLLPLSDGKPIKFEESYLLCGKCHGTKYRDWRYGIHGKRTGFWNGEKTYFRCVTCHDPHSPKFKPIAPLPPPMKPWTPKETKEVRH